MWGSKSSFIASKIQYRDNLFVSSIHTTYSILLWKSYWHIWNIKAKQKRIHNIQLSIKKDKTLVKNFFWRHRYWWHRSRCCHTIVTPLGVDKWPRETPIVRSVIITSHCDVLSAVEVQFEKNICLFRDSRWKFIIMFDVGTKLCNFSNGKKIFRLTKI